MQRLLSFLFQRVWPVTVQGAEHLPRRGPAVLVANHASYLDPLVLMHIAPTPPRFLVWKKHYETPLLGQLYRAMHAIPVDIWSGGQAIGHRVYRTALNHLRSGGILGVFPEGGRCPEGRFLKWRTGAARLALSSGAEVVPITLNGTYRAWPMHRAPRRAPITATVHPPVDVRRWQGMPGREAAAALTAHLRAVVASAYVPPAPADLPPPDWANPYLSDPRWREALDDGSLPS